MGKVEEAMEWVPFPDDLFSEDSSFIGAADTKAKYEKRAASFNPREFWEIHDWNAQCLIAQEKAALSQPATQGVKRKRADQATIKLEDRSKAPKIKHESTPTKPKQTSPASTASTTPPEPFNPYADDPSSYQLHETIDKFINRLRPSETTLAATGHPWIWIANPNSASHHRNADVGGFKQSATPLLEAFMKVRREVEDQNPEKPQGSITRMLKPERDQLEADIVKLAKDKHVTCGKWMLFPYPNDVDAVWWKVCNGTLEGRLGCAAKVATDDGDESRTQRLICIYTEDFSDKEDVQRVLSELKELGLVKDNPSSTGSGSNKGVIYYKCDAYTYLDITSDNEYRLKASMYNSRDMFKEMKNSNVRRHFK